MAPIFWHFDTVAFEYCPFSSILLCLFLAVVYVGSLYVWTPGQHGRDHPSTIKLRFLRVGLVCILMVPFLWTCSVNSYSVRARILFTWIGLRLQGLIMACVLPLLLTMVLFLGPLTLHYLDGIFSLYKDPEYWRSNAKNLIWLRNHIVAPFTEEFIFRACMLPLLVPSFGEWKALFICPLFFGVAHFHHMVDQIKTGKSLKQAMAMSLFQFSYTTLFGVYSAFLFLRTGHLVAPVIVHAFCNHMGFPNFNEVMAYTNPKRACVVTMFLLGLLLWCCLLYPLTKPAFYGNNLYDI